MDSINHSSAQVKLRSDGFLTMVILFFLFGVSAKHFIDEDSTTVSQNETTGSATYMIFVTSISSKAYNRLKKSPWEIFEKEREEKKKKNQEQVKAYFISTKKVTKGMGNIP